MQGSAKAYTIVWCKFVCSACMHDAVMFCNILLTYLLVEHAPCVLYVNILSYLQCAFYSSSNLDPLKDLTQLKVAKCELIARRAPSKNYVIVVCRCSVWCPLVDTSRVTDSLRCSITLMQLSSTCMWSLKPCGPWFKYILHVVYWVFRRTV